MRFGELPLVEAEGAILAHTHRLPARPGERKGPVLKKGRLLDADDVARLAEAGFERVWGAILEPGDVAEDEAATRLARAGLGPGVRAEPAATGRVNLFAEHRGVLVVEAPRVDDVNLVDARLTVATVPPYQVVEAGEMVATVKIIPFGVPEAALERSVAAARAAAPLVRVAPFARKRVALILTELPGVSEQQLARAEAAQAARIAHAGGGLEWQLRAPHETAEVAARVERVLAEGADLVLLLGASAMVDPGDVLPAAMTRIGARLEQVGMPVDPGNLLVLGWRGEAALVGVPGCARSLKRSGFDHVLERLAADLPVNAETIRRMGAGGLLAEIPSRPKPRLPAPRPRRVAAVVLAAGRSSRMGTRNKLLEPVDGVPMVVRVVDAFLASRAAPVVVVTGHEREAVEAALEGRPVRVVRNPDFAQGLSSSLAAGVRAVPRDADGALVALGDMPRVGSDPVDALLDAFDERSEPGIVVPVHAGRRGHPVLFAARFFEELAALEGDRGARRLLDRHAHLVSEVPVDDPAIHLDVDTPEALDELRGSRSETWGKEG